MESSGNETPRKPATLRDVAEAAGVSVWTASNTFSNPDRIAEATRELVLAAADALDYAGPNPLARTLALGQTGCIALVSPRDSAPLLQDPASGLVALGLLTECDRSWLSLVLAGGEERLAVDGRVFMRWAPDSRVRGPAVVVDGTADGLPSVRADAEGAAAELARVLLELGHRRIAVIAGPGDDDRLRAAVAALTGPARISLLRTSGSPWATEAHGKAAAHRVLAARPRPTAMMAMSDPLAVGALDAARRIGLEVPRDVSITGLGDLAGTAERGLTSALIPYRPMGELAGRILVDRIAGQPPPEPPVFPAPLAIRATTGRPPTG
jgi:DNA-binding LacI/PurR family transcriptional regulator